jgi:diguanylate cyclase (GGDEF)-like protein
MEAAMQPAHDAFEARLTKLPEEMPVALALLDVDEFKELNDERGREAGDAALRSLERTLATNLPEDAVVGRVGGDEYAVALPRTSPESALILLEEVRSHIAERDGVNVSVGIAARPQHATGASELMRAADEALFRAKREGRGRVAIYVEDRMTLKSNYYPKAALERLSKLSDATGRTEASLLREALDDLLASRSDEL